MTDIHSHIIFNVDDGSSSLEESIELIKYFKEVGFNNIIATPHFLRDTEYSAENDEKLEKLAILKEAVKKHNIDINLYLGNEIYISEHIDEDIKSNKIYTLNNTKYILFELPFHNEILNLPDIVYELKINGYIPILAHPERYDFLKRNYKEVDKLKEEGLLFQCNYSSILEYYGKDAKKLFKYMLKKHYVDYLGTDIHHINKTFTLDNFDKIKHKIIKIAGQDYFEEIIKNCDNLLKEEPIH